MSIRSQIYDRVVAVGGPGPYPMLAPQGVATPYIVYHFITKTSPAKGFGDDGGLKEVRVQFNCYSDTIAGMETVAGYVRSAFDFWESSSGSPKIQHSTIDLEQDGEAILEGESFLYVQKIDVILFYEG